METHPALIEEIKTFIEQNTAAAHLRRRNSVMYTNGVTLHGIARHVSQKLGIKIGKDTIHRLLLPHRKKTTASKRFKSLIEARVPPKQNSSEKKTHPDFHYTSAQVSLVNQLAQLSSHNTVLLSVDKKMKVEIGNPATSRRSNIRRFYLVKDAPNYCDHDFPHRNTKLTPAGYQWRKLKVTRSRSLSLKRGRAPYTNTHLFRSFSVPCKKLCFGSAPQSKDRLCRKKVMWPRSGYLNVQLYPSRTIESTSVMHMNFLKSYITEIKKQQVVHNVVSVADGGPDWSIKGIINLMTFGFLWEFLKLDTLIIQCYAPGHSRFNPIERTWSLLTKCIVSVVLPVQIEELNYVVPKDSEHEKWNVILDKAVEECGKFWHGSFYDGFPVSVQPFLTGNDAIPHLKKTHELLKTFSDICRFEISPGEISHVCPSL